MWTNQFCTWALTIRVICLPNAKLQDNHSGLCRNSLLMRNSQANIPAFDISPNLHFLGCILAQEQTLQISFSFLFISVQIQNYILPNCRIQILRPKLPKSWSTPQIAEIVKKRDIFLVQEAFSLLQSNLWEVTNLNKMWKNWRQMEKVLTRFYPSKNIANIRISIEI